jgi:hypothetical protein
MNKALKDWLSAVKMAKVKLGLPSDSFVVVKGELLKTAQKFYCSMGY